MEDEFRQQSEFDMSFSFLYRLNNIIYICDNASLELDYWKWFHGLMVLYREVSTELKGEVDNVLNLDKTKVKDEFVIVENMIADIEPLLSKYQAGSMNGTNYKLYKNLSAFDMYLRQVLKKSGLLIKMRQDSRFGLAHN